MITSTNPATGAVLAHYDEHTDAEVDCALAAAVAAQRAWAQQPIAARAAVLPAIARVLRERRGAYAHMISTEMGKPLGEARAEIEKCASTCEHYAQHGPAYLADTDVASNAGHSYVAYDPLGVVLAIMPWNYPFWQFIRFAAPVLVAGNGAILKHANNVPQCALALQQALLDGGVPAGLVTTVLVDASRVKALIDDPRIAAVTLTGSTAVGKLVAAQAGNVLKKQVLELGGSDAFIVLADADIGAAAKTAVKARFGNTGQSCISSKRFIVEDAVADAFVAAFAEHTRALVVGDPLDAATNIGPLARASLVAELDSQVQRSIAAGAILVTGGARREGPGCYYLPTILDHVTPAMAVAVEETFGPAAAVLRVKNADAAVALANATEFGLGAAIWSGDVVRARQLARRVEAGAVFINGMVASDARLPFGGIKQSGYGREPGEAGAREFTNTKTIWIGPAR
ncbi:NAD-dependent succinate-semialdehyde dehydrogenase [Duganella phyllosphaerae]|uniref:Succinate semialdehyde dehydrogenase [NAD(P)+] Sad n=1 Tax=Duganella phyllosphaerae TaxID=762836 RepID=A0A1E7WZI3_9BURK|nr:NAD-dependent succinate-semialdehyde dehydrogenase [Duganella phyllosphaerae]OFA05399.1 succinate semialdehyde dehydrogenase [NAD(P)+] Sad [Duganella phyllosphaerae]